MISRNTTIIALATPRQQSAIHMIRISGSRSYEIVEKLCNKKITKNSHTIERAFIYENSQIIDDVLLLKFVKPKSFTGDDLIEITCHGGLVIVDRIIELAISHGASHGKPGEFSMRALENGKLSLIQAESINSSIRSQSFNQLKAANELAYANNHILQKIEDLLYQAIGSVEVDIDYPEIDENASEAYNFVRSSTDQLIDLISQLLNDSQKFMQIDEGIKVAIVGVPNVGKSSLLNLLIKQDRAIVSEEAGTTRDLIEVPVLFNGIHIKLIDTAGIRSTSSKVERIGINKTYDSISNADVIVFITDGSRTIGEEEKAIVKDLPSERTILVANKSDLPNFKLPSPKYIAISTRSKDLTNLHESLNKHLTSIEFGEGNVLTSRRQVQLMQEILNNLLKIREEFTNLVPIDLISPYFNSVSELFQTLLGKNLSFDLLEEIFSRFCLGK